jgi:adenylate kinase
MLNLILFGPPGSGKGTQAEKLVKKYQLLHLSTGDIFRYEIGNKTELGMLAQSYMNKGELVPDSVTISMLRKKVEANPDVKGYIFDGFPRTIPQAQALDALLIEMKQPIAALIELVVPEDEIVRRLLSRGIASGRPDDVNETLIRKRISVYRAETTPVADYYDKFHKAHKIAGLGEIETIFQQVCRLIDAVPQH